MSAAGQRKAEEAFALASRGEAAAARKLLETYLRVRSGDSVARLALARILYETPAAKVDREASLAHFEAAANASDDPHEAWYHHVVALMGMDRTYAAWMLCDAALQRYPNDPMFLLMRGQAKVACGMSGLALDDLASAQKAYPSAEALMSIANISLYASNVSAETQRDHFIALGRALETDANVRTPEVPIDRAITRASTRAKGNAIVVALVSQDFREHPVAWFIESLLTHADPARLAFVLVHTAPAQDSGTERLRCLAARFEGTSGSSFHDVHALDDVALATFVRTLRVDRGQRVDVAIDLGGHTVGGRLGAFVHRLAPIQATYLGHPVTTGLRAIDIRIVDSLTDPVGSEHLSTERLARLDPCFVCYGPPAGAPVLARSESPTIRFGSFNAITKVSDVCALLWSRVLLANPGSTLVLKGATLAEASLRAFTRERFVKLGIDESRVQIFEPTTTTTEHLTAYNAIDIALDTFPYHGTTTTCEAMWMGVPVVSRIGDRHASRVGATLLNAVGLGDLCAKIDDEFVANASALARDAIRRNTLSGKGLDSLRSRMARSMLCDSADYANRFTLMIEGLVREYDERLADEAS